MLYLTLGLLLLLLAIDISGIRQRTTKEQLIYALAMFTASAYVIALSMGWEHPRMLEMLTTLLEKPGQLLRGWFGLKS